MTKDEIQSGVDGYRKWYHCIDLPFDIVTPGRDINPSMRWKAIKESLPSLNSKTVLDVGAWDGYYSFAAEKEGAKVLATDHCMWSGSGWGTKRGFNFAKKVLQSKVEEKDMDVYDFNPKNDGFFDVVLFLNVLYHLENPYKGFECVASVARNIIVIETLIDVLTTDYPYLRFIPNTLFDDPTNWFVPNEIAVLAMLRNFGFFVIKDYVSAQSPALDNENISRKTYIARRCPKYV